MKINDYFTLVNFTDASRTKDDIEWLVIHYVGATGSALQNANYFYDRFIGASAGYFVGFEGEKYRIVRDEDIAWHCGGGLQSNKGHKFFGICKNSNSIGIEMCVRNDSNDRSAESTGWYFEPETIEGTIELVKYLMKLYDIDVDHVIRHFDVTGKYCPSPFVRDEKAWELFKERLKPELKTLYRVRKVWDDPTTQIGAFSMLSNAKIVRDEYGKGYYVFDEEGKVVYPEMKKVGYVKVLVKDLNVRNVPSWDSSAVSEIVHKNEVFTVQEKVLVDGYPMYRLKSGLYISANEKYVEYYEK